MIVNEIDIDILSTADIELSRLQQVIDDRSHKNLQLQRQLQDLEKEKQAEIVKLRLEVISFSLFNIFITENIVFYWR